MGSRPAVFRIRRAINQFKWLLRPVFQRAIPFQIKLQPKKGKSQRPNGRVARDLFSRNWEVKFIWAILSYGVSHGRIWR